MEPITQLHSTTLGSWSESNSRDRGLIHQTTQVPLVLFIFLSKLYTQRGNWTHDLDVKRCILYWLSHPGTPKLIILKWTMQWHLVILTRLCTHYHVYQNIVIFQGKSIPTKHFLLCQHHIGLFSWICLIWILPHCIYQYKSFSWLNSILIYTLMF